MMQNKRVAVTGGIGSGKSSAVKMIKDLGYPVLSCDEIYAKLCTESEYLSKLNKLFPGCVKDGKLDRPFLSSLVFHDADALKKLNDFSHPLILERLFKKMDQFPLSFAEVPLLYESGAEKNFDYVLVISRSKEKRLFSVMERDSLSAEAALARIQSQRDWESLPENAYVIQNDGDLHELLIKIQKFLENLV